MGQMLASLGGAAGALGEGASLGSALGAGGTMKTILDIGGFMGGMGKDPFQTISGKSNSLTKGLDNFLTLQGMLGDRGGGGGFLPMTPMQGILPRMLGRRR